MSTTPSMTASWPVEMDAGNGASEMVMLAATSPRIRRGLSIYRANDNGLLLRIIERIWEDTQPPTFREEVHILDLRVDPVLPIYAISAYPRAELNMEVLYHRGDLPVVYQLQDKAQVFRLQHAVTGYRAAKSFENIRGTLIYYNNRRLPLVRRAGKMKGNGEAQFWRWPETRPNNIPLPPSPASSHTRTSAAPKDSARSMVPDMVRQNTAVSVQSDLRGQERVVMISTPPPVLVLFMQGGEQYTMLKIDVTNLQSIVDGTIVHLTTGGPSQGRRFRVQTLSVHHTNLRSWNIAALNPTSGLQSAKTREASSLSLQFESVAAVDVFTKWLLFLRADRLGADLEALQLRNMLRNARMPDLSKSPTSDRRPTESSLSIPSPISMHPSGSIDLVPLAQIPSFDPIEEEFWRELDDQKQVREIDGKSIHQPFELAR